MTAFTIEEGRTGDVIIMLREIPEFDSTPSLNEIMAKIGSVRHLVLTAYVEGKPAGFKIGYERGGTFYSWLGGVLPAYRRLGVAGRLAEAQEEWAKTHGYKTIWMKTRNRFPEMLMMAVGRGFQITGFDPRDKIGEHRIVLTKSL